ncbi:MAG: hypothetical protein HY599_06395 [Candidatus Omnitrophica bacterium]|nr:hypothetical protein [Candidatus Omnitrophota bacterium]
MSRIGSRAGIVGRLLQYLWRERLWWLIPAVIILLVFGGLIFFSQSSAVAPFVYTLF